MRTVVLVSCAKQKLIVKAPAKALYSSVLFKQSRAYAERNGDEWAILSAMHGLVLPDRQLAPYECPMSHYTAEGKRMWAARTAEKIKARWPPETTKFIVLAGKDYAKALEEFPHVETPLAGLGMGRRLGWLRDHGFRCESTFDAERR
jgi:hypothetical protein